MQLPAGVNRRYATISISILAILWIWVAFDRPYTLPSHISWDMYSNRPTSAPLIDVFDYPPTRSAAFQEVCANATFDSKITFVCDDSAGDVAEVRNSILTCVRFAMKVGADLVLPRITMREDYAGEKEGQGTSLDYMFDMEYFVNSLEHFCPDMTLYATAEEVSKSEKEGVAGYFALVPESLATKNPTGEYSIEDWHTAFNGWVAGQTKPGLDRIVVEIAKSSFTYPTGSDDVEFTNSFGRILKFGYDTGTMATSTLARFSNMFDHPFDITYPIISGIFLGVHFSTQKDPAMISKIDQVDFEYATQSKLFLEHAVSANFSTIYASSDVAYNLPQFYSDAAALNISVATKLDLLKGKDRETLLDFTPDQQMMVDYLVHTKASGFSGVGHSPFAWNIAMQRHKLAEQQSYSGGPEVFVDDLSLIFGTPGSQRKFVTGMWP